MVKTEIGLTDLARETRQRIYDFVSNDAGDQTIKVTLDQHDKLRFENGNTIFDLVLTAKIFAKEVLSYLFQYITFTLTDSLRTCSPIVQAFFHAFKPDAKIRAKKSAIPFAASSIWHTSRIHSSSNPTRGIMEAPFLAPDPTHTYSQS